ncbi:hypothetical protein BaRGS_00014216, partial [Batillaria attramentaria]
ALYSQIIMFWKFNLLTSSHVDTLLEKEDVTLRELMDEDDILQECKAQNRKLIDFLIQAENMEDMVKMITKEPAEDVEERVRFKYPNTACELLTSDVSQINDKLASDKELIDQLYSFLESDRPLNPLLASFFSKVMGLLITRKSEMIFDYLKMQKDFVGSLLHHIGTSAIMDLLLRLITCIESPETRRAVIEWLNEQQIVQRLVDSIVPSKDEDIHCNAAQSLCDIVRLGREQIIQLQDTTEPDPLLTTMELEETVAKLLSNMFDLEQNESVIVNGLFVIHTLLEVRRQGQEGLSDHMAALDTDRLSQGISSVLAAITPRLKNFHDLLINPPKQRYSSMPTSVGALEPPLGNARLQVAKLFTALVATNMASVNMELVNLNTLQALVDLHFRYMWNNFLHTQVEQCIVLILNNPAAEMDGTTEHPLLAQLFTDVRLVQRLLDEWEENDTQSQRGGRRKGFMGHLTKIANAMTSALERGSNSELIKEYWTEIPEESRQKWESFVSGTLAEVNKKNTVEFRGHPLASSSEDDDADFKDIPFPQDTAMQQAFSDYQLQQMTSNFIDQFGFNEEEFAEQEEKIDAPFSDRISSINFNIQANEVTQPNSTMFDQACNERIQQFDDDDSDEDIWVEKPLTFDKNAQHMRSERLQGEAARANSSDDSTDSEEELDSPHSIPQQPAVSSVTTTASTTVTVPTVMAAAEKMDVDSSEGPWSANGEVCSHAEPTATAMETSSPWEGVPPAEPREGWAEFEKASTTEDNWADFSSFSDMAGEGTGPRSSSPVAMDTSDTVRGNVYMVPGENSEPESSKLSSPEVKVEDLEEGKEQQPLPDSTSVTSSEAGWKESGVGEVNMEPKEVNPEPVSTPEAAAQSTVGLDMTTAASSTTDTSDFLTSSGLMRKSGVTGAQPDATPEAGDRAQADCNAAQEPDTTHSMELEAARRRKRWNGMMLQHLWLPRLVYRMVLFDKSASCNLWQLMMYRMAFKQMSIALSAALCCCWSTVKIPNGLHRASSQASGSLCDSVTVFMRV